jgi:hypothetical protein
MQTDLHDYDNEVVESYDEFIDQEFDHDEDSEQDDAPPRWTVARFVLLLLVLVLIAAVIVFVAIPYVDQFFRPEPLPLRPPVNT